MAISIGPFALATSLVIVLVCAAVAAVVGYMVGRRQRVSIVSTLADMLLAGALAARIVFVVTWFEIYRSAPWTMLDIRDGGFTPWAGVLGAVLVALWQAWRRAALRVPLMLGLLAGTLMWTILPAVLRMGTGPTLSDLEGISLTTMQGRTESLANLAHGKPLVVNLWATWCPPCRREMPELAAAQRQVPGVTFIFANQGENPVTVQKYLTASQLVLANVVLDPGKKLGEQLGSTALPTTLFFDASGRLVDTHIGALSSASLASKLQRLETAHSNLPK
ncbi:MAG: TlpA disulfide reductase family protein [Rhodoferax sp.]